MCSAKERVMPSGKTTFGFLSGRAWVLVLTSAGFFVAAINAFAMITALPTIQRDTHAREDIPNVAGKHSRR
jgi:hypothetical protein